MFQVIVFKNSGVSHHYFDEPEEACAFESEMLDCGYTTAII